LSDLTHVTNIEASARKYIVNWCRTTPVAGVATFGIGNVQRMLITFILNAVKLVAGFRIPYLFCRDEAEGRAWITRQRQILLAKESAQSAEHHQASGR
jgi:hypothetical protein